MTIPAPQAERIRDAVLALEDVPVVDLMALLRSGA
jgi:hypothetical protein